ncbi:hypothetical protein GO491_11395 [Flavobacteriaceae bacterium Ap0902]|nr:hypothetical protein [Flavobacteriaceae bacterium Ap0902]
MIERVKHILNNPLEVSASDLLMIEKEREKYPYFYPFILLQTKATSRHSAGQWERYVQKASVYTTNRKILYDYLNFEVVSPIDKKTESLNSSESNSTNPLETPSHIILELPEEDTDLNLDNNSSAFHPEDTNQPAQILTKSENQDNSAGESIEKNHSFIDWLKINKKEAPIENDKSISNPEKKEEIEEKFKIIEAFLDKNPKIVPAKEYKPSIDINSTNHKENLSHLMTETLANIYVEQNKYDKAIKAYRILRLKYPEKSGYFADRIKEIKELKN